MTDEKETQKILPYEVGAIMCDHDIIRMLGQLDTKLKSDMTILQRWNTAENQKVFWLNQYKFYWLKKDYYDTMSLVSRIDGKDTENGWFVWLKNYSLSVQGTFKDQDERNAAIYSEHFEILMPFLAGAGDQVDEAIFCYKQEKYFACSCVLFSCIEKNQRSVSDFDPSKVFKMSKQLHLKQAESVACFNKKYFVSFEKQMNGFMLNNFFSRSTEADPEPKEINRNRIMHGIFTRDVSKTDCLKLFVLLNSLLQFDDWLNSFRKMEKISALLNDQ